MAISWVMKGVNALVASRRMASVLRCWCVHTFEIYLYLLWAPAHTHLFQGPSWLSICSHHVYFIGWFSVIRITHQMYEGWNYSWTLRLFFCQFLLIFFCCFQILASQTCDECRVYTCVLWITQEPVRCGDTSSATCSMLSHGEYG